MSTTTHTIFPASMVHSGPMFGRQMPQRPALRRFAVRAHRWLAIASVVMVLVGAIGLGASAWASNNTQRSTIQPPTAQQVGVTPVTAEVAPAYIGGTPTRLVVPAAHIDLTIVNGYYDQQTGEWSLSPDKVQFATPTVEPNNQSGGTLLYGHNTQRIFAPLHGIPAGSEATVFTDNGHQLTYRLVSSQIVDPSDVSIFEYQGAPRLTLQTCTGMWSEDRKFFQFELVSAQ